MIEQAITEPKVTMTVSCPLEVYQWLKRTQRNVSGYVVHAIEAERHRGEEVQAQ